MGPSWAKPPLRPRRPWRLLEGGLPGEGAEDPADAVGVKAGAPGDVGQGIALAPERQDRAVLGGAVGQDALPEVLGLGDLAGAGLRGRKGARPVCFAEGFFAPGGLLVLADAVDQAVPRGDVEEAAEVVGVGEAPAGL